MGRSPIFFCQPLDSIQRPRWRGHLKWKSRGSRVKTPTHFAGQDTHPSHVSPFPHYVRRERETEREEQKRRRSTTTKKQISDSSPSSQTPIVKEPPPKGRFLFSSLSLSRLALFLSRFLKLGFLSFSEICEITVFVKLGFDFDFNLGIFYSVGLFACLVWFVLSVLLSIACIDSCWLRWIMWHFGFSFYLKNPRWSPNYSNKVENIYISTYSAFHYSGSDTMNPSIQHTWPFFVMKNSLYILTVVHLCCFIQSVNLWMSVLWYKWYW